MMKKTASIKRSKNQSVGQNTAVVHLLKQAVSLHQRGQIDEAATIYEKILDIQRENFDAWHLLGVIAGQKRDFPAAVQYITRAIALKDDSAEAYFSRGTAYKLSSDIRNAILDFKRTISLKPSHTGALNSLGVIQGESNLYESALEYYNQAISIDPRHTDAHYNKSLVLQRIHRSSEALESINKAISLKFNYAEAHSYKGVILRSLGRLEDARESSSTSLALDPSQYKTFIEHAETLRELCCFSEALGAFSEALRLQPDSEYLLGLKLHTQMYLCQWQGLAAQITSLAQRITNCEKVTPPFPLLTLIDDPGLQLSAAQTFNAHKFPATDALGELVTHPTHDKVRIGYFSADFHNHATAYLMAELFEATDPSRFEVYGFSFGPNKQDEMRQRIANTFHSFIDVANHSDHQVAAMSRKLGIDIAVDLKGYTKDSRTGIFAARCAPIQVSYLGYPGTMGAPYIDYLIADHTLIPEQSQCHYSEKIVYMPHSYQANDSQRQISNRIFTRAELGLPALGFVFCCFNNSYKIMPQTFDSWMRILKAVNGSTLWLLHDNPQTVKNLKQQAQRRGVEPERLIFAPRMPLPEHLARHRVADLFLDTLPCNAHTTASDALWAGLPVLTLAGESFAARVAASLINAVGLPELVTTNQDQYEALAVRLANDPQQLTHLRQTLAKNRTTSSLFDGKRFAKNLGIAYQRMHDIHLSGQKPAHIYL
jgi:predicted O-linked N-acetylglucosamine transferase (SPINDLY family)